MPSLFVSPTHVFDADPDLDAEVRSFFVFRAYRALR
jgi:hypothetical protein